MKAPNRDCTFLFCGRKFSGQMIEIVNNDESHPGDVIVSVSSVFKARSEKENDRHREFRFRVPLQSLGAN